jgi:glucosamine-6-phosphate deaminase
MTLQGTFSKDLLHYRIYETEQEMGESAAEFVKDEISKAIRDKGHANLILATGTSQFMFLDSLKSKAIDWQKVNVFHLDEYKGISDQWGCC